MCPSHLIFVATPSLECVHAMSIWIYVHLLLMCGPTPIVWWKPDCPQCVVSKSVATPCLECVHASVHEFMSTLHPMASPLPMDSYKETHIVWSHSPLLWSPPFLECVHASVHEFMYMSGIVLIGCPCILCVISVATPCLECVHPVYLHSMSGPPPMDVTWKVGCPFDVTACVSHAPWYVVPHLV